MTTLLRSLLIFLHLFLGINGIAGGGLLIIKTDGSMLGMDPGWLDGSPFRTFLVPGILLLLTLGIFPLVTAAGLVARRGYAWLNRLNLYRDMHWSWAYSLYTGIIAITWITVQLVLTSYFWIQPVIIFNGLLILVLTLTPGVISYYKIS